MQHKPILEGVDIAPVIESLEVAYSQAEVRFDEANRAYADALADEVEGHGDPYRTELAEAALDEARDACISACAALESAKSLALRQALSGLADRASLHGTVQ